MTIDLNAVLTELGRGRLGLDFKFLKLSILWQNLRDCYVSIPFQKNRMLDCEISYRNRGGDGKLLMSLS